MNAIATGQGTVPAPAPSPLTNSIKNAFGVLIAILSGVRVSGNIVSCLGFNLIWPDNFLMANLIRRTAAPLDSPI